jgi:hypothetical protein
MAVPGPSLPLGWGGVFQQRQFWKATPVTYFQQTESLISRAVSGLTVPAGYRPLE